MRRLFASSRRGIPVHVVSCRIPESIEVLRQYLGHGQTGALLGSSGVGKSTIVNRLVGHDLLRTQDVRESDSRGRHTSTARQLVRLPGTGVLIDTPGCASCSCGTPARRGAGAFDDIEMLAERLPIPRLPAPAGTGLLCPRAIAARRPAGERLESYHKLKAEQEHQGRQLDQRAQIDEKRRAKAGAKALRKRVQDKAGE